MIHSFFAEIQERQPLLNKNVKRQQVIEVKQGLIKIYVSVNDLSLHVQKGLVDLCFLMNVTVVLRRY